MDYLLRLISYIGWLLLHLAVTESCEGNTYAVYRLTFEGLWTKDRFPKVYPESRPKAEWSTVMGRTHRLGYTLFKLGEPTSNRLKTFVEVGDTSQLAAEGQGNSLIHDSFSTSNLELGYGKVEADFQAHADFALLSLVAKIVPSPDWFVGIDSFSLCSGLEWVRNADVDLWPLDAGTQRGYTFSSPRWRSDPVEVISQISSTFPNHTADAFYYPQLKALPAIARVSVRLMSILHRMQDDKISYGHAKSHQLALKPPVPQLIQTEAGSFLRAVLPPRPSAISAWTHEAPSTSTTLKEITTPTATTQKPYITSKKTLPVTKVTYTTTPQSKPITSRTTTTPTVPTTLHTTSTQSLTEREINTSTSSDTGQIYVPAMSEQEEGSTYIATFRDDDEDEEVATVYIDRGSGSLTEKDDLENSLIVDENINPQNETLTESYNKVSVASDISGYDKECSVSEWSSWSECSRTCGYGIKTRTREVTKWTGNIVCPDLKMEQLCGSMKKCNWNHFSLTFNSTRSLVTPNQRRRPKQPKLPKPNPTPQATVVSVYKQRAALKGREGHKKGSKRTTRY